MQSCDCLSASAVKSGFCGLHPEMCIFASKCQNAPNAFGGCLRADPPGSLQHSFRPPRSINGKDMERGRGQEKREGKESGGEGRN